MRRILWVVPLMAVLFSWQCSHYDALQQRGKESSSGSSESHEFGNNCMECHNKSGSEAVIAGGWWNIAGSLYTSNGSGPYTDAVIELWSAPDRQGTLYYTLEVDQLGNFYTEKIIDYNGTCFPVVVNSSGDYKYMEHAFHSGACANCHGNTEAVIMAP